jgi:hypothetical protein
MATFSRLGFPHSSFRQMGLFRWGVGVDIMAALGYALTARSSVMFIFAKGGSRP